jgi:hypothetical protein
VEAKQEESNPVYFPLSAFSLFRSSFVGTAVNLKAVANKTIEMWFFVRMMNSGFLIIGAAGLPLPHTFQRA